jgi:hypothetical protein
VKAPIDCWMMKDTWSIHTVEDYQSYWRRKSCHLHQHGWT